MVQKIEGAGDCYRCDVYTRTGRLVTSFDITAVPMPDFEETVRKAMPRTASVGRIIQHQEGVLKGRCVAEVKPEALAPADRFNSKRAFEGRAW